MCSYWESTRPKDKGEEMAMSEAMTATPRVKAIQRAALAMLVVAGVINYVDRATLAVANPLIRQDLGLNIADMDYLLSAFLWAYAFAQLPTGAMVDKLWPRVLLSCGLALWSFAQFLGGLVQSFGQFFAARLLLGAARRRNFRPARAWCGIGSIHAIAALRPASSIAPRPLAPQSPCRSSPS